MSAVTLTGHLIFNGRRLLRVTKSSRRPKLHAGERAVLVSVTVPDSVFREVIPEFALTLRESQVIEPRIEVLEP